MNILTNGYFEMFYYASDIQELMECYKYGVFGKSDSVIYDIPNMKYRYNILLNSNRLINILFILFAYLPRL